MFCFDPFECIIRILHGIERLCRKYEKTILAFTGIATVGAVVYAAMSLKSTERIAEANTVYNLQKDGRDLLTKISDDSKEGE